jgi:hypothetical protein
LGLLKNAQERKDKREKLQNERKKLQKDGWQGERTNGQDNTTRLALGLLHGPASPALWAWPAGPNAVKAN